MVPSSLHYLNTLQYLWLFALVGAILLGVFAHYPDPFWKAATYLYLGLALFQLFHSFYVGLRFKSQWHLKTAQFFVSYYLVVLAFGLVLFLVGDLGFFFGFLIAFGFVPTVFMLSGYVLRQARHLPATATSNRSSDDALLDDWPIQ